MYIIQNEFRIKDNGTGLPDEFKPGKTNTLGVTLLISLAMQLDGKAEFINKNGTECIIHFKEQIYKNKDGRNTIINEMPQ